MTATPTSPLPPARNLTLVTGPVRSGKSRHAEALLGTAPAVRYVATGPTAQDRPADAAWRTRLLAHQERRPTTWQTVETPDAAAAVRSAETPVLLDCLGTWLTAQVDALGWDDLDVATRVVRARGSELLDSVVASGHRVVVVTNEVGWSLVPTTPSGRFFQDELGRLNATFADAAATVHLVVAGRVLDLSTAPRAGAVPPRVLHA